MTKDELMALADAYAEEVAETPPHPTPLERALAVTKIEKARAALEAALDEVVRDAERYQWLRHGDNDELVLKHYVHTSGSFLPRNEQLDYEIDVAMKETK